jgi:membrane protein implicated in regulation of membrane protease activity
MPSPKPGNGGTLGCVAAWLLWLIAGGLFAAGEVASLDLVLLMFAGGAIGGMTVALLGGAVAFQFVAFIAVSLALLAFVRPIATRHLQQGPDHPQLGNANSVVGRTARVTQPVDRHSGRIKLGADEWTARSQHSGESFAVGDTVRILEVEGATAVVGDAFE